MFGLPTFAKFLRLPAQDAGYGLTRAICDAMDYYGHSESKNAVILHLRLLHLYRTEFRSTKDETIKGLSLLEMPKTCSLRCIAQVYKIMRSPVGGLTDALVAAVESVKLTKGRESDQQEMDAKHAIISKELRDCVDAMDAIYMSRDDVLEAAEAETLELIEAYRIERGDPEPKDERYDGPAQDFLVPSPYNIDLLCAEPYYTRGWAEKTVLQRAGWATGDTALQALTAQIISSNIKRQKQVAKKALVECEPKPASIKQKRMADLEQKTK